jgi:pyoverdine/dityrosine biosynthesis protein Dit1
MNTTRIYLAGQPKDGSKFEIYIDGKPSGEFWDIHTIQRMLTHAQYKEFTKGETIFKIDNTKFENRNKKSLLNSRLNLFDL